MLEFDIYKAWITVDDKEVEQYDVNVDQEKKEVTCWIASEEEKEYKVHWRIDKFRHPTQGGVIVDGHPCGGVVDVEEIDSREFRKRGIYPTATTYKPFTFSKVTTSDDDALLSNPAAPDIGLIKIVVQRADVLQYDLPWTGQTAPKSQTFHEKSKKMINHQTDFNKAEHTMPAITKVKTSLIGDPLVTFKFRYRPLAILQAQDIAPRPPPQRVSDSPQPPPRNPPSAGSRKRAKFELDSDGEVIEGDEDDDDEIQALRARLNALEEKKKGKADGSNPRKRIKREPIVGITIDLTED